MNKKQLDDIWAESHPILLFIFLASLALAINVGWTDLSMLANGEHPNMKKWFYAAFIAAIVQLSQVFQRRRDRNKAEPSARGDGIPPPQP